MWFNLDSRTVYDKELQYPIGQVGADEEGYPLKKDKDTYIVTRVIPIPMIKK